jgi:hypothetical protein
MLGLAATAAAAGFSGQGLGALEAFAPASNVERVHATRHRSCQVHLLRPSFCHRHIRVINFVKSPKRWQIVRCPISQCKITLRKKKG